MDSFNELKREEEQRRAAEQRARNWLKEVIPLQAEIYEKFGFIEVPSRLYKGRTYRIHGGEGDFRTSLYQNGKKLARLCLMMLDPEIPPTDRVIAEYYLLQGDEQHYLATANIQNLVPESRASRLGSIYGLSGNGGLSGAGNPIPIRWMRPAIKIILLFVGFAIAWMGLAKYGNLMTSSGTPSGVFLDKAWRAGLLGAFIGAVAWWIYNLKRYRSSR